MLSGMNVLSIGQTIRSGSCAATAASISCPALTTWTVTSWPSSVSAIYARWLRLLWAETRNRTFNPLSVAVLMVLPVIDAPYSLFMQKRTNVQSGKCVVSRVDIPRCEPGGNEGDGYDGSTRHRRVARSTAPRADAAAGNVGAAASLDDADRLGARPSACPLRGRDRPRVLQRLPRHHADRRLRRPRRPPGT